VSLLSLLLLLLLLALLFGLLMLGFLVTLSFFGLAPLSLFGLPLLLLLLALLLGLLTLSFLVTLSLLGLAPLSLFGLPLLLLLLALSSARLIRECDASGLARVRTGLDSAVGTGRDDGVNRNSRDASLLSSGLVLAGLPCSNR